jgi:hypothetical protein
VPPPEVKAGDPDTTKDKAFLEGFVVELDGAHTRTDGRPIQLSPGCHVAKTTADSLLGATDGVVVMWKQVPIVYFRVDAKPGYHYRVERKVEPLAGRYNVLLVVLGTYDEKGNLVAQQRIAYGANSNRERPVCPAT